MNYNHTAWPYGHAMNINGPQSVWAKFGSVFRNFIPGISVYFRLFRLQFGIAFWRWPIKYLPRETVNYPQHLHTLASRLAARFDSLGGVLDLESAISYESAAIELTSETHPSFPYLLESSARFRYARFQRLGGIADLNMAELTGRRAIGLLPPDHPELPEWLNHLVAVLLARFGQLGMANDLDDALAISKQVLELVRGSDAEIHLSGLLNFGLCNFRRFERFGDLRGLDQVISASTEVLQLARDDHPSLPIYLGNLAVYLCTRFEQFGQMQDLEDSRRYAERAVFLSPQSVKPRSVLTMCFLMRFQRLGEASDADQAILHQQMAIDLMEEGTPGLSVHYSNLGTYISYPL
jgi:tetratricopeptide (TPR) repeat protein